jgi:hypothetical protein
MTFAHRCGPRIRLRCATRRCASGICRGCARDPRAGQLTARGAVERADKLITELSEAFGTYTRARRHDARGPEMTAWRRAAAFLDGGVFCGCPPLDA